MNDNSNNISDNINDRIKGLTIKQKLFCEYYVLSFNKADAYKKAYGIEDSTQASAAGIRLLRNEKILAYVNHLQEQARKEMNITPEFLIQKAMHVYEESVKPQKNFAFNPDTKKMEPTGDYHIDSKGANGALEVIAKVTGLNVQKVNVDAKVTKTKADKLAEELFGE
jgi:phage terminase small subunit